MLKVRYLTNKGIDPIPYVKDEFPTTILTLLSEPREEILDKTGEDLTYLAAIGILDSDNSNFLHDYLMTLSTEDFDTESMKIFKFTYYYIRGEFSTGNVQKILNRSIAEYIITNSTLNLEILNYYSVGVPVAILIGVEDEEIAKQLRWWSEIDADYLLDYLDFANDKHVDFCLQQLNDRNELINSVVRMILRKTSWIDINSVRKCVTKLLRYGYVCDDLMRDVGNDYLAQEDVIAEGIILACPNNDWSWLDKYILSLEDIKLMYWWRNRIDI